MSNDRPLFDDEELPSWLNNAGITGGGKDAPQQSSTDSNAETVGSSDNADINDLSWLDDPSGQAAPWMQDAAPVEPAASGETPSWMQNIKPTGGTGPFGALNPDDAAP